MSKLKQSRPEQHVPDARAPAEPEGDTIEMRRARRMAALQKLAGIWADRKDIPADGLEYQLQLRAEWRD